MNLARLIKIYLSETYNKVCIGKHLSDNFSVQNDLKQERCFYHHCLSTLL
jgi:hypothetical protein